MMRPRRMEGKIVWAVAGLEALIVWLSNFNGVWWMTMLAGLVLGLLAPSRRGIVAAAAAGAAGWALGLLWVAVHDPIGPTASALSVMLGMGTGPLPALLVTILLGTLLAASAAWLGTALQQFARPER